MLVLCCKPRNRKVSESVPHRCATSNGHRWPPHAVSADVDDRESCSFYRRKNAAAGNFEDTPDAICFALRILWESARFGNSAVNLLMQGRRVYTSVSGDLFM